jgi:hypothetical protein
VSQVITTHLRVTSFSTAMLLLPLK